MKSTFQSLLGSLALLSMICVCLGCSHAVPAAPAGSAGSLPQRPTPPTADVVELNADNADAEVLQPDVPVIVVVCHRMREACQIEQPVVAQLAVEFRGLVKFTHIELSDGGPLVESMGKAPWDELPAIIAMRDGHNLAVTRGVMDIDALRRWVAHAFFHGPLNFDTDSSSP